MTFIFRKQPDETKPTGYYKEKEWKEFLGSLGPGTRVGFESGYQRWSAPSAIRAVVRRGGMPLATLVDITNIKKDYDTVIVGVQTDAFIRSHNCGGAAEFGFGLWTSTYNLTVVLECSGSAKALIQEQKEKAKQQRKKLAMCKKYRLTPDGRYDTSGSSSSY